MIRTLSSRCRNQKARCFSTAELVDTMLHSPDHWRRRRALARAITLVENTNHVESDLWKLLPPRTPPFRLGFAGPPGAGKSTFIEALGLHVLQEQPDLDLAVLCIDPTSPRSGGSILGDQTRMTELSKKAYVRASPGTVGGLAPQTDDVIQVCGRAGYEHVWVETVGLGQSEVEIRQCVDMLLLMVPPGGGDELQGMKKGILEVADAVVVTKSDVGNLARQTAADYKAAMPFNTAKTRLWERPPVLLASAYTKDGLDTVWEHVTRFQKELHESGELEARRHEQQTYWMWKHLQRLVQERMHDKLQTPAQTLEAQVHQGVLPPRVAAHQLLDSFFSS